MTQLLCGKNEARVGAVKLNWRDIFDHNKLATPPADFGHEKLVGDKWGMLGNGPDPAYPNLQPAGDCGIAEALHAHMLWSALHGVSIPLNSVVAQKNYSDVTQFDPTKYDPQTEENPTDQGVDVPELIKYRFNTGLVDAAGNRHKIGAAVALEPGNWEQLIYALYYADAGVTLGVSMTQQWMDAFTKGGDPVIWDAVRKPTAIGGHAICGVAFHNQLVRPVTWGTDNVGVTEKGYVQASDETFAYFSDEMLNNGVDINGWDKQQMLDQLPLLQDVSTPILNPEPPAAVAEAEAA